MRTKINLKVDMTPMVDLGFLLITFFIFTTSMSDAKTMNLYMPAKEGITPVPSSGTMNILIGKSGDLYYYEGTLMYDGSNIIPVTSTALRQEIIRKKKEVMDFYIPDPACEARAVAGKTSVDDCRQKDLMILIKPNADADYNSIVQVLDEMAINRIARYALIEPLNEEVQFFR